MSRYTIGIPEVPDVLDLAEVWQDLYVGPLVVTPRNPGVEVFGPVG